VEVGLVAGQRHHAEQLARLDILMVMGLVALSYLCGGKHDSTENQR
jgi:hypothetical protein